MCSVPAEAELNFLTVLTSMIVNSDLSMLSLKLDGVISFSHEREI